LEKPRRAHDIGAVTNPLQIKNLVRGARCGVAIALLAGCGGRQHVETPAPTRPLPTAGLAAQQVSVLPLTLLAAEDSLHWQAKFADRRAALAQADSGDGRRAHRAPGVPDHGARRRRRSLVGADGRREEPHAGAAVTREATLIAGDGIGPEITQATLQVLDGLGVRIEWDEEYGGM